MSMDILGQRVAELRKQRGVRQEIWRMRWAFRRRRFPSGKTPAFPALLLFARELIDKPSMFVVQAG